MANHDYDDGYYDGDEFIEDEDAPATGFEAFIRENLAATPWWAISLSMHLFVCLVIAPLFEGAPAPQIPPIKMTAELGMVEDPPIEEKVNELPESPIQNPDLAPCEDAVDSDLPQADHNETADNEDFQEAKGDPNATSRAQLMGKFNNEAIGAGGGAGGTFGGRRGGRLDLAKGGGGGAATENAVMLGLQWLAKHQDEDGKWDGDGFMRHDPPSDVCTGAAKMTWVDPGLTGLATLAFLGAGHTHRYGMFRETVKKAVQYLMKIQAANGLIGGQRGHYMYNHSICALALAEAYGMTKSPLVKGAAQKSIEYLISARNPGLAWRYGERDGENDLSVTGWCVMALKSAKAAEIDASGLDEAFKQSAAWMESITDEEYGVSGYKARPPRGWQGPTSSRFDNPELGVNTATTHGANHTPTAIATMCRVFFGYARTDARLNNGATIVSQMPPVWDTGGAGKLSKVDYYYWYYATLAMFQVGGEHWKQWNKCMKAAIVTHQHTKAGSSRGSWDPIDAWGFGGGRVYATAINVLSLEIYYRYAKVFH